MIARHFLASIATLAHISPLHCFQHPFAAQPRLSQCRGFKLPLTKRVCQKEKYDMLGCAGPLHQSSTSLSEEEISADFLASSTFEEDQRALMATVSPGAEQFTMKRVFNGALLAGSFALALYVILRVDAGMTRGWTQQEIMMRIPVDTWRSYEFSLSENPMETKTAINVIIYLLGDWLSQTVFQKKNILDFDASRTVKNGFIGLCFGPLVHQYYEFSDQILPLGVGENMMNRFYKILMDQTIYLSVKCSIYVTAVSVLNGSTLEDGINQVKLRLKDIMFTAWSFWPFVHCITYTVIPAQHRVLWVNCVDLIWNAVLATKASGTAKEDDKIQPEDLDIDAPPVDFDASMFSAEEVDRVEIQLNMTEEQLTAVEAGTTKT